MSWTDTLTNKIYKYSKKYMKTHSTSYVTRELQIKTRYHCTPIRMTFIKSKTLTTPNAEEDREQDEFSFISSENAKWYSHFGRQFSSFSEN